MDAQVRLGLIKAVSALLFWYVTNVATVILNKYVFQLAQFSYPLTLTSIHFMCCSSLAFFVIRVMRLKSFPLMDISRKDILHKVLPFAAVFCLNIVLGNISLRFVPVSFMQTVKSLVPAFTVALQTLLGMRFSRSIYFSIIPVVGGVFLATYTEVNFDMVGFMAALLACFTTAFMVVMGGRLLEFKLDPINLLYYMAPISLGLLLPVVFAAEYSGVREYFATEKPLLSNGFLSCVLFSSGVIAFMLNWSQFLAIKYTSSLTLTVAGNLKGAVAIILSIIIFKNEVTWLNMMGCMVAIAGVTWYGLLRHKESLLKAKIAEQLRAKGTGDGQDVEKEPKSDLEKVAQENWAREAMEREDDKEMLSPRIHVADGGKTPRNLKL